ncbi:hypothetical protein HII36_13795 [Nonomuraea sp. NN258]|uniref:hypothetical protein n=1 Tax=Nonomuraea antri TaxID=2730852 RepID=UPI00156A3F52|nr:hypothetical protein [Nonomuraea antri]NRQ32906.1 hypothetical protein [Nonomuraea antri]
MLDNGFTAGLIRERSEVRDAASPESTSANTTSGVAEIEAEPEESANLCAAAVGVSATHSPGVSGACDTCSGSGQQQS